jgi:glycosyltransferase involved in cell wall biosynthesis
VERAPEALAAAIEDLQQNPQKAEKMTDEGRRIVESRRWPEIIRELEDIYYDISGH